MDNKRKKSLSSSSHRRPLSIHDELWQVAEERAQEILWTIEPNTLSERNRKNVADYVQSLISSYYGLQVGVFCPIIIFVNIYWWSWFSTFGLFFVL